MWCVNRGLYQGRGRLESASDSTVTIQGDVEFNMDDARFSGTTVLAGNITNHRALEFLSEVRFDSPGSAIAFEGIGVTEFGNGSALDFVGDTTLRVGTGHTLRFTSNLSPIQVNDILNQGNIEVTFGSWEIAPRVGQATTYTNQGTTTVGEFGGFTFNGSSDSSTSMTIDNRGGVFDVVSALQFGSGEMSLRGGDLQGAGTVLVEPAARLRLEEPVFLGVSSFTSQGELVLTNELHIANSFVASDGQIIVDGAATLTGSGTTSLDSRSRILLGEVSTLTIAAGHTLDLAGPIVSVGPGTTAFVNEGIVNMGVSVFDVGYSSQSQSVSGFSVTNSGTIHLEKSAVRLTTSGSESHLLFDNTDGLLDIGDGSLVQAWGGGVVEFLGGNVDGNGELRVSEGTRLDLSSNVVLNNRLVNVTTDGLLRVEGTITNNATIEFDRSFLSVDSQSAILGNGSIDFSALGSGSGIRLLDGGDLTLGAGQTVDITSAEIISIRTTRRKPHKRRQFVRRVWC